MPLSVNFSVGQSYLNPDGLSIVDTSSGSDGTITNRRIYLQTANGSYLVQAGNTLDYTNWPTPSADITLQVLNQDYALSILVQWLNNASVVVYSKEEVYCFTLYSEQFFYYLSQQQAAANANLQDTNYFTNKMKLRVYIDSANNAVQYASDIVGGQNSLNSAAYMIDNQNIFF